jgi:ABC-2 type transport system permease protein
LICLLGTAIGFIVRNTAGAISLLFAILMVVPILGEFLPALDKYLPTSAIDSLLTARINGDMLLQPLPAFLLLCAYVAAAAGSAVLMLLRRDA